MKAITTHVWEGILKDLLCRLPIKFVFDDHLTLSLMVALESPRSFVFGDKELDKLIAKGMPANYRLADCLYAANLTEFDNIFTVKIKLTGGLIQAASQLSLLDQSLEKIGQFFFNTKMNELKAKGLPFDDCCNMRFFSFFSKSSLV